MISWFDLFPLKGMGDCVYFGIKKSVMTMRIFFGFLLLLGETVSAQYRVVLRITNEDTRRPIAGASVMVKGSNKGLVSDSAGVVMLVGFGEGSYSFQVSCTG